MYEDIKQLPLSPVNHYLLAGVLSRLPRLSRAEAFFICLKINKMLGGELYEIHKHAAPALENGMESTVCQRETWDQP